MKKFIFIVGVFLGMLRTFNIANFIQAQESFDIGSAIKRDDEKCLRGVGDGCFNITALILPKNNVNQINKTRSLMTVSQDVVYGATRMVGTVLTIVIIYCGFMYIWSARGGKDTNAYKKGLISAAVGAILVWGAYAIVRLIQYIAKG